MRKLLISACLLGEICRYDGKSKPICDLERLQKHYILLPVCPECMGGLSTPRPPAEIQADGRVVNREGQDVSLQYRRGARAALEIARRKGCVLALLKEKSPSCGIGSVYDGSFSGTLTAGDGICAALLQKNGVQVFGESQVESLIKQAEKGTMHIEKASIGQLPKILDIYDHARRYMRENGNLTQWAGGYPGEQVLREDILKERLYVCLEGRELLAVFCYFEGEDPTYRRIFEGAWQNDRSYGVIHRIAVARHGKGVASFCFDHCFARCGNLKIDTHADNIPMQRALEKNGFVRCGIIYLENGDPRIAYQKCGSEREDK